MAEAWIDVIAPGGCLIVVVPNKASNFDHRRPTTMFAHLLTDYAANVGEDDTTHFDEVLALTDLRLTSRAHIRTRPLFAGSLRRTWCIAASTTTCSMPRC